MRRLGEFWGFEGSLPGVRGRSAGLYQHIQIFKFGKNFRGFGWGGVGIVQRFDQLDRSSSHDVMQPIQVDIIIEDGLHTFEANVSFLEESLDHLRPEGIYVCEDIMWNRVEEWCDRLETIY